MKPFSSSPALQAEAQRWAWLCVLAAWLLGTQQPDSPETARVKIRGYGVEIGEVENALRNHAEIRDAAVVAKATTEEEARLIAYVTRQNESKPSIARLRHWLKTTLPDYMIPSSFVFLDALPLTPNGKVDRRALPDPGNKRPNLDYSLQPATMETERQLIAIWSAMVPLPVN